MFKAFLMIVIFFKCLWWAITGKLSYSCHWTSLLQVLDKRAGTRPGPSPFLLPGTRPKAVLANSTCIVASVLPSFLGRFLGSFDHPPFLFLLLSHFMYNSASVLNSIWLLGPISPQALLHCWYFFASFFLTTVPYSSFLHFPACSSVCQPLCTSLHQP